MAISDDDDDCFWGRTEQREFSYEVANGDSSVVLTAVQDRDVCNGTPAFPSHGHCVWDAAVLLADYLQSTNARFDDKKAVELGAGVGLIGMTLAMLGAEVALTDQEYALPLLRKNVDVNFGDDKTSLTNVKRPVAEVCQWGEKLQAGGVLTSWAKNVDVVVFSDVLYHASAFRLLIVTLHELVSLSTDVYFSFETRNKTIEASFLAQLRKTFDIKAIRREDNEKVFASFEYPDELFMYHAKLKADSKKL